MVLTNHGLGFGCTGNWMCHICINGKGSKSDTSITKNDKTDKSKPSLLLANGRAKHGLMRKKYEYKNACQTPGCDGSGNVSSSLSNHRRYVF